jgi:hypothetical protein
MQGSAAMGSIECGGAAAAQRLAMAAWSGGPHGPRGCCTSYHTCALHVVRRCARPAHVELSAQQPDVLKRSECRARTELKSMTGKADGRGRFARLGYLTCR